MVFFSFGCFLCQTLNAEVENRSWDNWYTFTYFLKQQKLPQSLYYTLNNATKERITEIANGASYQIYRNSEGVVTEILIPIENEEQIQISLNNGKYSLKITPVFFEQKQKVLSFEMGSEKLFDEILARSESLGLAGVASGVISDMVGKVLPGETVAIIYEQQFRLGRMYGFPKIESISVKQKDGTTKMAVGVQGRLYNEKGEEFDRYFLTAPAFYPITSHFKPKRWHPVLKKYRSHYGTDYGTPLDTPVRAVGDGIVKFVGEQNGFGNVIKIQHDGEYMSIYAHLGEFGDGIKVGMSVKQGKIIAYSGNSGLSTGPHLHLGIYKNGIPVDSRTVVKIFDENIGVSLTQLNVAFAKQRKLVARAMKTLTHTSIEEDVTTIANLFMRSKHERIARIALDNILKEKQQKQN